MASGTMAILSKPSLNRIPQANAPFRVAKFKTPLINFIVIIVRVKKNAQKPNGRPLYFIQKCVQINRVVVKIFK